MKSELAIRRGRIRNRILLTRSHQLALADGMPDSPRNKAQLRLQLKHGTPREFAFACAGAIGEIGVDEARDAALKYLKEWNALA